MAHITLTCSIHSVFSCAEQHGPRLLNKKQVKTDPATRLELHTHKQHGRHLNTSFVYRCQGLKRVQLLCDLGPVSHLSGPLSPSV